MVKIKKNYIAWHVDSRAFREDWNDCQKLQFFARYAILAPSGHNTQPWHFSSNKNTLFLKVSPSRNLPFSGALAAEPYISLGACLETLVLAARGFGYKVSAKYSLQKNVVAAIKLCGKTRAEPRLLSAITDRRSNRSFYKSEQLSPKIVKSITSIHFDNIFIQAIDSRADIAFLVEQTKQATTAIMTKSEFREELSKWVRNNITKQHDGMPGFVQGMPTPPSLLARHIVKRIDISKGQAKKDAVRLANSPVIVVLSAHDTSESSFLDAGRAYASICILAQQRGLATSGVGAAVIDPKAKQAIARHFKLAHLPTALIRIGHPTKSARHTPRWPLEKVLD